MVIQNAGHILPLEQPEQTNAAVLEFFFKTIG
jgi:pimeloyl-ACP methyl ester carboxylesterase